MKKCWHRIFSLLTTCLFSRRKEREANDKMSETVNDRAPTRLPPSLPSRPPPSMQTKENLWSPSNSILQQSRTKHIASKDTLNRIWSCISGIHVNYELYILWQLIALNISSLRSKQNLIDGLHVSQTGSMMLTRWYILFKWIFDTHLC